MTGRTGGRASGGSHSACPERQPAASTVWPARSSRPSAVAHAGEPIAVEDRRGGLARRRSAPPRRARAPRPARRPAPAGRPLPRRAAWTPPADRGREPGLELAALARPEPLAVEPERALQLVAPAQLLGLVAVERDVQRAAAPVADGGARVRPRARRRSPDTGRAEARLSSSSASSPQDASPSRRQHPGGDAGRARSRASRASITATRSPRWAARHAHARPITPAPDHQGVEASSRLVPSAPFSLCGRCASPSLRRHYPDQVQTVGGTSRPLSPSLGLPLFRPHGSPHGRRCACWILSRCPRTTVALCAGRSTRSTPTARTSTPRATRQPGIYADEPELVPLRAALEGTSLQRAHACDPRLLEREPGELGRAPSRDRSHRAGRRGRAGRWDADRRRAGRRGPVSKSRVAFAIHVRDGLITRNAVHLSEADARRDLGAD